MEKLMYAKDFTIDKEEYQVTVVGGGSAGICAAIAAARMGARTLLIENTGWLGGIGTSAAMVEFGPIMRAGLRVVGGIPYELMQRMKSFGGAIIKDDTEGLYFAPDTFAHVAMNMCEEAGVHMMLHTRFIDSITENGRITGILIDNKEGFKIIRSDIFIDCTGDGDVYFKAGVPYLAGREADGGVQPMTLVFFVNDVNYARFLKDVKEQGGGDPDVYFMSLVTIAKNNGQFTIPIVRPGSTGPVPRFGRKHDLSSCEVFINGTNIVGKSGIKADDLTQAELTTRKQIYTMFEFLKTYVPGFEDCYISHVPNSIGVRETRRLKGIYTLCQEDLKERNRFYDTISVGFNMIDIHQVDGEDFDLTHFPPGHYYDVPYRCLISGEIDNLLVAGRCISATHEALGAIRVMSNTMPIGEAAGTAAALAAQQKGTVGMLNINELRCILQKNNVVLGF